MLKKSSIVAFGLILLIAAVLLAEGENQPTVEELRKGRLRGSPTATVWTGEQAKPDTPAPASPAVIYTVNNTGDAGPGTLRQAILNANANAGHDVINFNILPAGGVKTIFPLTPLPWLLDNAGVTIDGLTQLGAGIGASPPSTLNLKIEIDGIICPSVGPAGSTRGLVLQSSNDTIQGLIVNNWWESGICTQGGPINEYAQFNLVRWNISGMDSTGTVCKGNGRGMTALWAGICICNSPADEFTPAFASYNTIQENLSSCNYTEGITVVGPIQPGDVNNNFVLGNYVGTDITGTLDRGNVHEGICLCEGTHHNLVRRNLSSGNDYDGIGAQGYNNVPFPPPPIQTRSNQIDSNTVGIDVNGNPLPNTMAGITVGEYGPSQWGCADSNIIEHNTIAENGWDGVAVWEDGVNSFNADQNLISQNSIYDNIGLGIDLQNDGVTPNDGINDPDSLANQEMNFPVINSAAYSGGITTISGTLPILPPNTATVEVFQARLDPSGYGEGERYLGSAITDAVGNWSLTDATLLPGDSVTATATDANNNTSEFSATFPVTTGVQFPRDHFKVWSVDQISFSFFPQVKDQFHSEYFDIDVTRLDYFSNPVNKNDEGIQRPFDHLTWYKTSPLLDEREVEYQNQFESTTVSIDSLVYLLVPTKKDTLPQPDSLDHYLCYRIANPRTIIRQVKLQDQFHIEYIDSLRSKYFCAPCDKIHNQQEYIRFDSSTHYVAYEIFPKDTMNPTVETQDQFRAGPLTIWQSELLLVPTTKEEVSVVDTCEYYKPAYVDYAPAGMPDFDQKQNNWTCPSTGAWSHCGPVALADCFWWFDSKFETSGTPPPTVADNYPLVQNFTGVAGNDDHDTSNAIPFVDSMAVYCNTNAGTSCGTNVFDLATGAQNWLNKVGLGSAYNIQVVPIDPVFGFEYIREQVLLSQDVILLIGFWQEQTPGYCERRGGHFMTVAGVCTDPADSALCFSDPFYDLNEGDPPGPPPHNADVHNDAQFVSGPHGTMHHDKYYVDSSTCATVGQPFFLELRNYAAVPAWVANFDGQNRFDTTVAPVPPNGNPVHAILEFAVVICPDTTPEPTPGKIKHNIDGYEPGDGSPIGTDWHELWPDYCEYWTCSSWVDNGDGVLSQCDTIDFVHVPTGRKIWEHVEKVTPTITVTDVDDPANTMYLDLIDPNPMCTLITNPVGTFWHEIWPNYCTVWEIIGWTDNGNGYLDSCDYVDLESSGGGATQTCHVEAVETDIVTVPLPNPDADEYDHNIDGYHPSMGDPTGTQWHELWPVYCQWWDLAEWRDNGDGTLSFCDTIKFQSTADPDSIVWKHIEEVTLTIKAANEIDSFYFDFMCGNQNVDPITDPINTFWHEVWPTFCQRFICVGWTDNGSGVLDYCDYIDLMAISGPDSGTVAQYHVKAAETDIVTTIIDYVEVPDTCDYYKQGYLDFCPNGMPDFDQKQDAWTSPFTGNWSWCGPLALGNCIWWFDSKFEPNPVDPRPFWPGPGNPPLNDGYPLISSYDPAGIWDDHDTNDVMPFIQALMPMCNTDVLVPGTRLADLEIGFQNWIAAAGLAGLYSTYVIHGPDFDELRDSILSCQDVILLLGFYELIDGGPDCQWLGGHYVTSAGVCTEETDICISDPMFDANEGEPPAGGAHGSSVHNDASLVSGPHGSYHHDRYNLMPNVYTCPSPATWMFTNYPNNWADVFVFENLNPIDPMPPVTYFGGPIVVLLDAALIICPAVPPPPEPTPGKVKHCFDTSGYRPSMGSPVGTNWHELWPNYCEYWLCNSWIDNGDGILSYCDTIDFVHVPTGRKIWEHVELVMPTIKVEIDSPLIIWYLDGLDPNPLCTNITNPIGSWWHEVYPNYCVIWQITGWIDNGNGYLDYCDTVTIETPDGSEVDTGHVSEGVETDIVTTPLPTPGDEYDHNIDGYIPMMGSPVGTWWHELWPNYCRQYFLDTWHDNGDGILSYCDTIRFSGLIPEDTVWKHIEEVTGTIKANDGIDTFYFDYMCGNPNVEPITDPIGTYWHEILQVFCQRWVCVGWADNGNGYLDSCDYIDLMKMDEPDSGLVVPYHVDGWETDIISTYVHVGPPSDTAIILDTVYGLNPSGELPAGPDTKKFMMRWKYTTGNPIHGFANGFRVYSPDGATWQPIVLDTVSHGWPTRFDLGIWINYWSANGSGADTAGITGSALTGSGITAPFDTLVWWIETKVYEADTGKHLCIDSSFQPPANPWIWFDNFTTPILPNWSGPHCWEIVGCCNHDGIRGDVDYSRSINVADAVFLVDYIFFGGPPPPCLEEGDADGDGSINVADVVYLVDYIFFSGPAPAPCP